MLAYRLQHGPIQTVTGRSLDEAPGWQTAPMLFRVLFRRRHLAVPPDDLPSPASRKGSQDLNSSGSAALQTTSVRMSIPRNTLWALCTAIPIQALRYRFVG